MSAVAVDGVWKFYGDFPALRDVRLEAAPGSCLALIGRNGAGKTTLLRNHSRLFARAAARSGSSATRAGNRNAAAIGFIGHGIAVYEELTALENLTLSAGFTDWRIRTARRSNGWSARGWSASATG